MLQAFGKTGAKAGEAGFKYSMAKPQKITCTWNQKSLMDRAKRVRGFGNLLEQTGCLLVTKSPLDKVAKRKEI